MKRDLPGAGVSIAGSLLAMGLLCTAAPAIGSQAMATQTPPLPSCEGLEDVMAANPLGAGPVDWSVVPLDRTPVNGPIVSLVPGAGEAENLLVVPLDGAPQDRLTSWPAAPGASVFTMVARGDGAALALHLYAHNGCGDVLVLSRDGRTAHRPFRDRVPEVVLDPTWSPDGTMLAVKGAFGVDAEGRFVSVAGSVWGWEPATDAITDLGRPCDGCWLAEDSMVWSPDGSRLAVTYSGDTCPRFLHTPDDRRTFDPEATFAPPCWAPGIALVGRSGGWRLVVAQPELPEESNLHLAGWLDDRTVLLDEPGGTDIRLDVDAGTWSPVQVPEGVLRLSPDRRRAVVLDGDPGLVVVDLGTGATTTIAVPDEPRFAWSPDSTILALGLFGVEGYRSGIHLVPADGSSPPRLLRQGPFGMMAWLPG